MSDNDDSIEQWYGFNEETVEALLNDGSNPDVPHTIEHHFASANFNQLERAAVDAFKAGFEVGDAEEMMLDDGGKVFCFDAVVDRVLDVEKLNDDTDVLQKIAQKHQVHYDGWGTYFIE